MAVRIVCPACKAIMQVADELRGKRVKCKGCSGVVAIPEAAAPIVAEFAEKKRMPPAPPAAAPTRRRSADDEDSDDDRAAPRRKKKKKKSSNMLPVWLGVGGGVFVLLLVVVIVLAFRSPSPPVQADAPNQPQAAVPNQQAPAQAMNAVMEKRNAPPLIPDPPAGETLKGEQIYQRLLQSTVWIVSSHKIGVANNNRPLAQIVPQQPPGIPGGVPRPPGIGQIPAMPQPPGFGQPGMPQQPGFGQPKLPGFQSKLPKIKAPTIRPPTMPNLPGMNPGANMLPEANQTSTLRNTTWDGSETLVGFGKLRFQFVSNISVIMVDAQDTSRGNFVHNGNSVTITFGGGVIYNGTINGTTMSGNATNGQTNWTWNVNRTSAAAAPANPAPGGGIVAKSSGSGSLVDRKHRLIVTNVHVVGNSDTVAIYFPDFDAQGELVVHSDAYKQKPGLVGRVVMKEERADLALVQLERLPDGVQPLAVAKTKAKPAQQVHSVGNPGASKGLWIYSPGKVRQVFQDQWKIFDDLDGKTHNYNAMKLETDSAINPGDSGGPLVDDRAAIVGVAHGGSITANNMSFFIEASEVRQILERYYRTVNDKLP